MADRAILFIDGSNWFHGLGKVGVLNRSRLDYKRISEKLIGPRQWIETRYYIGQVDQRYNATLYAQQRRFLSSLESIDPRILVLLGRIEPRPSESKAAAELQTYLKEAQAQIDPQVFARLSDIASRHSEAIVFVEKAVDVHLASDLVKLAVANAYDAAYLLTADGDYTPAVETVRSLGKKVYAASCQSGAQLARAVNTFIRLPREWFDDCYR